jgi:hypothetical protein
MGQASSYPRCSFQDIQKRKNDSILINTLPLQKQDYLIKGTIHGLQETDRINELLYKNKNKRIEIIIYGVDCQDLSVYKKFTQLKSFGFVNVSIYMGGIFEWALLQEIYGSNFPTDGDISDPLDVYKKN